MGSVATGLLRVKRVLIAGASGAGKSTMARRLGAVLDLPYVEIDGLYHGPDWQPRASFVGDVERLAASERWVTEWQYGAVRDRLAARAELMVWLDYPRWRVMERVTRRTLRRRLLATELWNGNREPPLHTFFSDPDHIVRWAWRTHGKYEGLVSRAVEQRPELRVLRFRRPAEAEAWLARLTPARAGQGRT